MTPETSPHSVFITGASSGLGAALAREYARPGCHLGLFARRKDLLERLGAELRASGARVSVFVGDVTELAQIESALHAFDRECGRLEVVIANAGLGESVDTSLLDPESAGRILKVNLLGLVQTLLPAARLMKRAGSGTLVGMSSVAGYRALPGSLTYSASKAGVITFMEGLQLELSGSGVSAMSICPGFVRTPLTDRNDFAMPLLMEPEEAARRMVRAIAKKVPRYTFPRRYWALAQVLRWAPHAVLHAVSPKSPHKRPQPTARRTSTFG